MAKLTMLTEHSPFMMGFVFVTEKGNAVIIDGGRPADMPYLFELVGNRKIAAWILTHPHFDHISGFNEVMRDPEVRERVGSVYCHFPSVDFVLKCEPQFVTQEAPCSVRDFEAVRPLFGEKVHVVESGDTLDVDELHFAFLCAGGERYYLPKPNLAVNESSIVFRVTAEGHRSVLFLGDLGPEGGRELLRTKKEMLSSDIVQMAHHGHSGVSEEVYKAISPSACLWCAAHWLYEEEDVEFEPELWGTKHQRKWMEALGVKEHYLSGDGTQEIPLK